MCSSSDAWQNLEARGLLLDLTDRGVDVAVVAGRLHVTPADQLTDEDVAAVQAHRDDMRLLVLAADARTLDRLAAMQAGQLRRGAPVPGRCDTCGEVLPAHRRAGACGWCRLALVQFAHWRVAQAAATTGTVPAALADAAVAAVLSPRLLGLFDTRISGLTNNLFAKEVA